MSELGRRAARILFALSATADTRFTLDVYRYLLGDAPPEIVGVFVEDPALLAHAGSRLAREIVLSGLERRLESGSLERQLRARSGALRRLLETESARLGLKLAFETVRAERRAALARAASEADALVVEAAAMRDALEVWSALPPLAPLRALVLTPERWPARDVVVVTGETGGLDGVPSESTLDAALRVARSTGASLTVLHAGESAWPGHEALARRLRQAGVRLGGYASLGRGRIDARALAARAAHSRLLVLPPAVSADIELVTELAARLRSGLMLLRGGEPAHDDEPE